MIEVTDHLVCILNENWPEGVSRGEGMRLGLIAVAAEIERHYDVRPRQVAAGREHASADAHGLIRCHTPGPDDFRCERTPEHPGRHGHYGYDGTSAGLVRW